MFKNVCNQLCLLYNRVVSISYKKHADMYVALFTVFGLL